MEESDTIAESCDIFLNIIEKTDRRRLAADRKNRMEEDEIMKITTVLFDLDGTLLPMDNDAFTKGYFKFLVTKMAAYGYEPQQLIDAIWTGTAAMVKNDGSKSNETAFWDVVSKIYGEKILADKPVFNEFYEKEFQAARALCGENPKAAQTVRKAKEAGFRVALATNPIFPAVATESRIRWTGLEPSEFELYTTYENIGLCKPNPAYYLEIAERLGVKPEECLMVGNDAIEDVAAQKAGMQVFLLTDCLINKEDLDISGFANGNFDQLMAFIEQIQDAK